MILFLGCSLTWGQGLQIEKWLLDGFDSDFCNKHSVPNYHAENLSYRDSEFRKSKSYPNLVAEKLDVSYSTKWGNGGSNDEILFIVENLDKLIHPYTLDLIVIQFTDMVRNDMFQYVDKKNYYDLVNVDVQNQIMKIDYHLNKNFNQKIPWLALSWHDEYSMFLNKKYENNFIKLEYDGKSFNSLKSLLSYGKEKQIFELCDIYDGIEDGHPNYEFNKVVADSIIRKIKKENIKFRRYNN